MRIVKLASLNTESVEADMLKLIPQWNVNRMSPIGDKAFVKLPDRVLQDPVYDDDWNLVIPAVMAGETRYDVIVPEGFAVPVLLTMVAPEISDHKIY